MPKVFEALCSRIPQRFLMSVLVCGVWVVSSLHHTIYFSAVNEMAAMTQMTDYADRQSEPQRNLTCPAFWDERKEFLSKASNSPIIFDKQISYNALQIVYVSTIFTLIACGIIVDSCALKLTIELALVGTTLITLLYPVLAQWGIYPFLVGRIIQSTCFAMVYPSSTAMVARWAPNTERATFMGIISSGDYFGRMLGLIMNIPNTPFKENWNLRFYVTGVVGLVWCICWMSLFKSDPVYNKYISKREVAYIYNNLEGFSRTAKTWNIKIPWKSIALSPPYLSLIVSNCCTNWFEVVVARHALTLYTQKVLQFNKLQAIVYCGGSHVTYVFSIIYWGVVSDWLVKNGFTERTSTRKFFILLGGSTPPIFLFLIPLFTCDSTIATVFIIFMSFLHGMAHGNLYANHIDLSPQYAGILFALETCVSYIGILFYDRFAGIFCLDYSRPECFWKLYSVIAVVMLASSWQYFLFGSADVQPWNWYRTEKDANKETDDNQDDTRSESSVLGMIDL